MENVYLALWHKNFTVKSSFFNKNSFDESGNWYIFITVGFFHYLEETFFIAVVSEKKCGVANDAEAFLEARMCNAFDKIS